MARLALRDPPRTYQVGTDGWVTISDCGSIALDPGETAELEFPAGNATVSVIRRDWGFELPLPQDADLVVAGRNPDRLHLLLGLPEQRAALQSYLDRETMTLRAPLAAIVDED